MRGGESPVYPSTLKCWCSYTYTYSLQPIQSTVHTNITRAGLVGGEKKWTSDCTFFAVLHISSIINYPG